MSNMVESIIPIVREASGLMVRSGFDVMEKGSSVNLVTSSDLAVQHFLVDRLSALIPGCGFICEEEDLDDESKEYTWIIDPIDGTANYARGISDCCISVALFIATFVGTRTLRINPILMICFAGFAGLLLLY